MAFLSFNFPACTSFIQRHQPIHTVDTSVDLLLPMDVIVVLCLQKCFNKHLSFTYVAYQEHNWPLCVHLTIALAVKFHQFIYITNSMILNCKFPRNSNILAVKIVFINTVRYYPL